MLGYMFALFTEVFPLLILYTTQIINQA